MATGKVNGKNKGSSFERKIANLLSDRFKDYLGIEKGFRRNADSGSFFGGTNMHRVDKYAMENASFGDLMCPNNFVFSIECKHYKSAPSFQSIINKEVPQWDKWLEQAEQDALNSKKQALLIIKYNSVPEFVLINTQLSIKKIISYKNYYAYKLEDVLTISNKFFFSAPI